MKSLKSDALRKTLCEQFTFLDEFVGAFRKGRYRMYLDSRGQQDIYVDALSENCQIEHLDLILSDLEYMVAELQERPRHDPLASHHLWSNNPNSHFQSSFGSLGHLGYSSSPASSLTLEAMLNAMTRVIHQRVDRPEDQEELLAHLQAIVDHPDISNLLPFSLSTLP
jgi:hypothetical protein